MAIETFEQKCMWKILTDTFKKTLEECTECGGFNICCKDYVSKVAYDRLYTNKTRRGI